jgi:hypothetical protein
MEVKNLFSPWSFTLDAELDHLAVAKKKELDRLA